MSRDFDSPWKETLELYLERVLRLLFPRLHQRVDWSVPYESLDAELQQIVREGELGERRADKLFRVRARDGSDLYLLIHVEVQSQYDASFTERMFVYSYRLRDRYNQPVESLAILADETRTWRPSHYEQETITTRTVFEFATVKLFDWSTRVEELETGENPVGLIVLAHLQSQATHGNDAERRDWKFRLFRGLLLRGLSPEEVRQFLRAIDWLLDLPKDLDRQLRFDILNWEKEQTMPRLSSFEEFAKEEGFEAGLRAGNEKAVKFLLMALEFRFGEDGIRYGEELKARPLTEWAEKLEANIRSVQTLDELKARMA
jgi:hypothetical protein